MGRCGTSAEHAWQPQAQNPSTNATLCGTHWLGGQPLWAFVSAALGHGKGREMMTHLRLCGAPHLANYVWHHPQVSGEAIRVSS